MKVNQEVIIATFGGSTPQSMDGSFSIYLTPDFHIGVSIFPGGTCTKYSCVGKNMGCKKHYKYILASEHQIVSESDTKTFFHHPNPTIF